jgi:hypothetical protein
MSNAVSSKQPKIKKKTKKLLTHFVQHSVIMTARHSNFAVNQIESAHLLYSSKVNSSWLIRKQKTDLALGEHQRK